MSGKWFALSVLTAVLALGTDAQARPLKAASEPAATAAGAGATEDLSAKAKKKRKYFKRGDTYNTRLR